MVPSSYLRIYQPLASFPLEEQDRWAAYIEKNPALPEDTRYTHVSFADASQTGLLYPTMQDHAYLKNVDGKWLVCPWRSKLRILVGMLAYRNSLPPDSANFWIPQDEALKAAGELEEMRTTDPEMRSNILTASWHVPLRWFMGFDESEIIMTEVEGRSGGGRLKTHLRVRYETDVRRARSRVERGLSILRDAGMGESECQPVAELAEWMNEFSYDSLVELDYGSVADLFTREDLATDRSASEIWNCLEALAEGDYENSAARYNDLAFWWNRVKSLEIAN
ncbi:MAG: hypothetical protein ABR507_03055 [Actinomycetota bacterium]